MKETIRHDVERVRRVNDTRGRHGSVGAPSIPVARESASRPHERTGGEMRVGPYTVRRRVHWGCSTVPYLFDLIVDGGIARTTTCPPSEAECAEAARVWRAARQARGEADKPKGRGRPRKVAA